MSGGRIVVVGDVMTDVVASLSGPVAQGSDTPARVTLRGGGAGANVAVWLARAGAPATLIGRVGDDGPGRDAVEALRAEGVDARLATPRAPRRSSARAPARSSSGSAASTCSCRTATRPPR